MENNKDGFSFFVITDTHYFENSLGASGEAYERRSLTDQKCIAETGAIIDAGFDILASQRETGTVIIPGDLVFNGEKESHREFIKKLYRLREAGKKIYVITAGHDYNDSPVAYIGDKTVPVEGTSRGELYDLYRDFGFADVISEHRRTLSYTARLTEGLRLLALNCDAPGQGERGFDEEQTEWIKEQILKARECGDYIFAMCHYPILPGSPIMNFISDATIGRRREVADMLCESGLELIFTGHMHMQSLNTYNHPNGNKLYDICTGSFVGCPCSIRKVTFLNDNRIEITSSTIDDFDYDKKGMNAREYFEWRFNRMITDTIDAMVNDYDYFARKIGIDGSKLLVKIPVKLLGRLLQTLTLGKLGRLFFIKVDQSIKNILLKDFAVELVRNIFIGDQPYTSETPQYKAFEALLKRLKPLTRILEKKLGAKRGELRDIKGFALSLIGKDEKRDNNAVLPINNDYILDKV